MVTSSDSSPTRLVLTSASRASDAAHLATHDIAAVAAVLQADYRLVGGNAVTLLTYLHQARDIPSRDTADADLGAASSVVSDPRLPDELDKLGYTRIEGNRFRRRTYSASAPLDLVIDVLAPAVGDRLATNRPYGALVVDEVPGLMLALRMPPTTAEVEVALSSGKHLRYSVALPHVLSALALKAYAFAGRAATRDAVDIWRLAGAAHAAGVTADDWVTGATTRDTLLLFERDFTRPTSAGIRALRVTGAQEARVRLLVSALLPEDPSR